MPRTVVSPDLTPPSPPLQAALPALSVFLWSTGFVSPKFGLPHAEPLTFVLLRFAIVAALFTLLSLATRAPWPRDRQSWMHSAVVAVFFHCGYLAGVFTALSEGVAAGVTALIVGIQPLLTAAFASRFLGERSSPWQWVGLLLGTTGVALVVADKVAFGSGSPVGFAFALLALFSITFGTLYQKRFLADMDLRSGAAAQYLISAAVMAVIAPAVETMHIDWTGEFIGAVAYITLIVSFAGVSVFFYLLKTGLAVRVVSYFFLIPPVTALFGYILFDEQLTGLALAGMAVAVTGVALVHRRRA